MSPLFGKKKKPSSILVLDIESGSVGSGLVVLSEEKPRLLGQERKSLFSRGKPSASKLLEDIEKETEHSLARLSHVAANMRAHGAPTDVSRVAIFLHAPWAGVSILPERAKADAHDETLDRLRAAAGGVLSNAPISFHSFSTTTTPIVHGVYNAPEETLVCTIGSEVAEVSFLKRGSIMGHATVPTGLNTLLRTLESHAGISRAEALSILSLSRSSREHVWAEALAAGMSHLAHELSLGAGELLSPARTSQQVFVVAPRGSADFFARSFTEDAGMHELFAPGSTIRAVSSRALVPHLASHPAQPDIPLLLESLFVDTRFGI